MYILWMLVIGVVVGTGAQMFWHSRGYAMTITLGLVGSCAAALLGRALGWLQGPASSTGLAACAGGAVLALVIYGVTLRRFAVDRR
jgi:uncharacterized membrane protein YeaQ/YmgE (transglycosylase-associated protein family)